MERSHFQFWMAIKAGGSVIPETGHAPEPSRVVGRNSAAKLDAQTEIGGKPTRGAVLRDAGGIAENDRTDGFKAEGCGERIKLTIAV